MADLDPSKSLVCIYNSKDEPVGAGFLIAKYHILTCTHVYDEAKDAAGLIKMNFPLLEGNRYFQVHLNRRYEINKNPKPGEIEDITVIEIPHDIKFSESPCPVPLSKISETKLTNRKVEMYGFPVDMDRDHWVTGTIRRKGSDGRIQIDHEGQRTVVRGFSGTIVWDGKDNTVVGMIADVYKKDDKVIASYMIPVNILKKVVLDLKLEIPLPIPIIPEAYIKRITDCCRYMDIDKLREKGRVIQVDLPEIFIPLYTNSPVWKQGVKKQNTPDIEQERTQNIEELMSENEYLLIEGDAGSGKTTLLKYYAHKMISRCHNNANNVRLPVLILLKDVRGKDLPLGIAGAESLLNDHLSGLDVETIKSFCTSGKITVLLDGLDEIQSDLRDRVVQSFADFRNTYQGCKIILSGRPHGIAGTVVDRFGNRHVRILPLNMGQIEEFIMKWFQCVYDVDSLIGEKTAKDMIGEIRSHSKIDRLTDNPLMLTAICILYHDGKELPGQRAELYKKFVTNLLYRRFDDPENVRYFLMALAHNMHIRRIRGIDRKDAKDILCTVYRRGKKENEIQYNQRLEEVFDRIEPNSGLIKIENGQYNFRHLTFQEFFTAMHIVERETDYSKAVQNFWNDEWYKEVIELYIGYLSIGNRRWANQIVKEILEQDDSNPYYKWRLAARSLTDIHQDTRESEVVELAHKSLLSVFDSDTAPIPRAESGEILGRLGDPRDLEVFVSITGGKYKLSTGKKSLKPFEICKYPVTNQWFAKFFKIDGYKNKDFWSNEGWKWLKDEKIEHPMFWYDHQWNCPNSPVVGVSFWEAEAFAKWLCSARKDGYKYRLPDENEWESAATGFENREYAWGNTFNKNFCNSGESDINKTSPVGIFKSGITPEGIFDLNGNVWEWTCSLYGIGSARVLRGGSWDNGARYCRSAFRFYWHPDNRDVNLGFRLSRSSS